MLLQQRIKNIIRVASYVCLILTWRCLCQRQTYLSNNRRPKLFPQLIDPEFFLLVHYFTFVMLEAGVHGSSSKHWKTAWKLVVVLPFYIWFSRFSSKAFQTQHRLKSCLSRDGGHFGWDGRYSMCVMAVMSSFITVKGHKFVSPDVAFPGTGAAKIPGLLQGQLTWEWLPIILIPT